MIRVFVSSCRTTDLVEATCLQGLVANDRSGRCRLADAPELADLIIIVGIREADAFKNLRAHAIWKRFPESSFGYYEGDNPPSLLRGVYSSATHFKSIGGRMRSSGYPITAVWRPNPRPSQPPAYLGPKQFLMSFLGRRSHPVRKRLFATAWPKDEVLFHDTTDSHDHFSSDGVDLGEYRERYWRIMGASKFAVCPRGAGASSLRLFEAMSMGVAPVIVSDAWIPPEGPDWARFALFVREAEIRSLYDVVKPHESEWEERGQAAWAAFQAHFSTERILHHILDSVQSIAQSQRLPERWYVRFAPFLLALEWGYQARWKVEVRMKRLLRQMARRGQSK